MAYELKQNLKLTQQLIMTPQLQQAIKLLQLSRLELVDLIQQEMQENPLLEEVATDEQVEEPENEEQIRAAERTQEITGQGDGKQEFDWNNYLEEYGSSITKHYQERDDEFSWDNVLYKRPSLVDHMMWQLKMARFSKEEMKIGELIIGNIDDNGYLTSSIQEITNFSGMGQSEVENVLRKIQDFDPPGVGARDIKECLIIQARIYGFLCPLVEAIINHHIKDVELKNYANIARKLKANINDVMEAIALISKMDPKPGSRYQEDNAVTIIPDVYVFKTGDDYKIILNDEGVPRLRINEFYRELINNHADDINTESGRRYIKEKIQSATWLIKSIQQRQRTLYRVSESIVKFQRDFFDHGISYLKPMVLRDIADDLEMHESTISRVVTNKYMHSQRGIFELKYFFSSAIQGTDGDTFASKTIRENIRKIINSEDPQKPYSDNDIAALLKKEGIDIARRTIAKYREMMKILPSSRRKKFSSKKKKD